MNGDEDPVSRTLNALACPRRKGISCKCDVTSWESHLELFQTTMSEYGRVDIVIANAGIAERGRFSLTSRSDDPEKPPLDTLKVNLIGVLYSKCAKDTYLYPIPDHLRSHSNTPGNLLYVKVSRFSPFPGASWIYWCVVLASTTTSHVDHHRAQPRSTECLAVSCMQLQSTGCVQPTDALSHN